MFNKYIGDGPVCVRGWGGDFTNYDYERQEITFIYLLLSIIKFTSKIRNPPKNLWRHTGCWAMMQETVRYLEKTA
jgi:hypothetical protein